MLSFLSHPPPRTDTSSKDYIISSDGAVTTNFNTPTNADQKFYIRQNFNASKIRDLPKESYMRLPPCWHWDKTKRLTVEQGKMMVLLEGKYLEVWPYKTFTLKPGDQHTSFITPTEVFWLRDMVARVEFEDGSGEKFWRNLFGYLDDCHRANVHPDIFQILLILYDNQTSLVVPKVPVKLGKFIGKWILGYVGGKVIGEKLLGYKSSYPEYYIEKGLEKKTQ